MNYSMDEERLYRIGESLGLDIPRKCPSRQPGKDIYLSLVHFISKPRTRGEMERWLKEHYGKTNTLFDRSEYAEDTQQKGLRPMSSNVNICFPFREATVYRQMPMFNREPYHTLDGRNRNMSELQEGS